MTAEVDVVLTNNSNSKEFHFRCVAPFKNKKTQPSIDIPFIATTARNRVIFRFTGQAQDVTFTFAIFNDGVDVANGTHTSTVISVAQQIQYLMEEIFTEEYNTDWNLQQAVHFGNEVNSEITGTIEDIELDHQQGPGTIVIGTLYFKRGNIGNLS